MINRPQAYTHKAGDEKRRHTLALLRTPGIGPVTYQAIIKQFPHLPSLFTCSRAELVDYGFNARQIKGLLSPPWRLVEDDLRWEQQSGQRHILIWGEKRYPFSLAEIPAPPPVIYLQGQLDALSAPNRLAMVGSRKPSYQGKELAFSFACQLARAGVTVVSGLAQGIDGASHQGALAGGGKTLAVLGSGLDNIYPVEHVALAQRIEEQGALLSELPPGTKPNAAHFPRRNRIISGLSESVLVVEAAVKSGSLITARYALEQGRDVFAVPGSLYNHQARGCHALLKQGAALVETAEDILIEMGLNVCSAVSFDNKATPLLSAEEKALLAAVGEMPTSVDLLVCRLGLTVNTLMPRLTALELKGMLKVVTGGYVRLN